MASRNNHFSKDYQPTQYIEENYEDFSHHNIIGAFQKPSRAKGAASRSASHSSHESRVNNRRETIFSKSVVSSHRYTPVEQERMILQPQSGLLKEQQLLLDTESASVEVDSKQLALIAQPLSKVKKPQASLFDIANKYGYLQNQNKKKQSFNLKLEKASLPKASGKGSFGRAVSIAEATEASNDYLLYKVKNSIDRFKTDKYRYQPHASFYQQPSKSIQFIHDSLSAREHRMNQSLGWPNRKKSTGSSSANGPSILGENNIAKYSSNSQVSSTDLKSKLEKSKFNAQKSIRERRESSSLPSKELKVILNPLTSRNPVLTKPNFTSGSSLVPAQNQVAPSLKQTPLSTNAFLQSSILFPMKTAQDDTSPDFASQPTAELQAHTYFENHPQMADEIPSAGSLEHNQKQPSKAQNSTLETGNHLSSQRLSMPPENYKVSIQRGKKKIVSESFKLNDIFPSSMTNEPTEGDPENKLTPNLKQYYRKRYAPPQSRNRIALSSMSSMNPAANIFILSDPASMATSQQSFRFPQVQPPIHPHVVGQILEQGRSKSKRYKSEDPRDTFDVFLDRQDRLKPLNLQNQINQLIMQSFMMSVSPEPSTDEKFVLLPIANEADFLESFHELLQQEQSLEEEPKKAPATSSKPTEDANSKLLEFLANPGSFPEEFFQRYASILLKNTSAGEDSQRRGTHLSSIDESGMNRISGLAGSSARSGMQSLRVPWVKPKNKESRNSFHTEHTLYRGSNQKSLSPRSPIGLGNLQRILVQESPKDGKVTVSQQVQIEDPAYSSKIHNALKQKQHIYNILSRQLKDQKSTSPERKRVLPAMPIDTIGRQTHRPFQQSLMTLAQMIQNQQAKQQDTSMTQGTDYRQDSVASQERNSVKIESIMQVNQVKHEGITLDKASKESLRRPKLVEPSEPVSLNQLSELKLSEKPKLLDEKPLQSPFKSPSQFGASSVQPNLQASGQFEVKNNFTFNSMEKGQSSDFQTTSFISRRPKNTSKPKLLKGSSSKGTNKDIAILLQNSMKDTKTNERLSTSLNKTSDQFIVLDDRKDPSKSTLNMTSMRLGDSGMLSKGDKLFDLKTNLPMKFFIATPQQRFQPLKEGPSEMDESSKMKFNISQRLLDLDNYVDHQRQEIENGMTKLAAFRKSAFLNSIKEQEAQSKQIQDNIDELQAKLKKQRESKSFDLKAEPKHLRAHSMLDNKPLKSILDTEKNPHYLPEVKPRVFGKANKDLADVNYSDRKASKRSLVLKQRVSLQSINGKLLTQPTEKQATTEESLNLPRTNKSQVLEPHDYLESLRLKNSSQLSKADPSQDGKKIEKIKQELSHIQARLKKRQNQYINNRGSSDTRVGQKQVRREIGFIEQIERIPWKEQRRRWLEKRIEECKSRLSD